MSTRMDIAGDLSSEEEEFAPSEDSGSSDEDVDVTLMRSSVEMEVDDVREETIRQLGGLVTSMGFIRAQENRRRSSKRSQFCYRFFVSIFFITASFLLIRTRHLRDELALTKAKLEITEQDATNLRLQILRIQPEGICAAEQLVEAVCGDLEGRRRHDESGRQTGVSTEKKVHLDVDDNNDESPVLTDDAESDLIADSERKTRTTPSIDTDTSGRSKIDIPMTNTSREMAYETVSVQGQNDVESALPQQMEVDVSNGDDAIVLERSNRSKQDSEELHSEMKNQNERVSVIPTKSPGIDEERAASDDEIKQRDKITDVQDTEETQNDVKRPSRAAQSHGDSFTKELDEQETTPSTIDGIKQEKLFKAERITTDGDSNSDEKPAGEQPSNGYEAPHNYADFLLSPRILVTCFIAYQLFKRLYDQFAGEPMHRQ